MRKWLWIGHTLRKRDKSIERQHIRLESAGILKERKNEANLGKGPFSRMQENVAKHGAGLRDGLETGSDGDAARSPVFLTERRDTLAHASCSHYSPSNRYGRRQQVG
jgi:hypothetical protein